jgi:hypothetical protein
MLNIVNFSVNKKKFFFIKNALFIKWCFFYMLFFNCVYFYILYILLDITFTVFTYNIIVDFSISVSYLFVNLVELFLSSYSVRLSRCVPN